MASPLIQYCEQSNPSILEEVKLMRPRPTNARRVHDSFLAAGERRLLVWMGERTPRWINSDHLTALAFVAQVLAGVGYFLAGWNRYALLGVIACLALNWLGDSLDGTLARVRHEERPRYGFYVDHMADSFGAVALMGGLALSGYMHPAIAIGLLVAFLLLSVQSYLATYTLGEFHLSFWRFGPTELRLLLAAGNIVLMLHPMVLQRRFRLFDLGGAIGLAGMGLMLVYFTAQNTRKLYRLEKIQCAG